MTLTTDFIKILMKLLGHVGGGGVMDFNTYLLRGGIAKWHRLTQGGRGGLKCSENLTRIFWMAPNLNSQYKAAFPNSYLLLKLIEIYNWNSFFNDHIDIWYLKFF
jgi:hypothetical protein